ncbi:MAG: metal-dependent transcriptional regulator [Clostridiales bacterium]|nr:metal-dependent transcriptional regulator [Clostridiales bacterium]MCD8366711.1 metal-dependent transcriptional regulator [Clostridiales bacterium]
MEIHESSENYLEAILMVKKEKGVCRSIDVVRKLNFSKPSVSVAMSNLRKSGYITMDQDGWLDLTDAGLEIAERMYERHTILSAWLMSIGVPEATATEDACRMEHDMSVITFEKIKAYLSRHRDDVEA